MVVREIITEIFRAKQSHAILGAKIVFLHERAPNFCVTAIFGPFFVKFLVLDFLVIFLVEILVLGFSERVFRTRFRV